jgi:hypothetical protein
VLAVATIRVNINCYDSEDTDMDYKQEMLKLFRTTRSAAERAGYTWRLSFDDFVELWQPHWTERRSRQLQLSRNGYAGAYERDNVRVDTRSNHVRDQHARQKSQRQLWPSVVRNISALWDTATAEQIALARESLSRYAGHEGIAADSLGISVQGFRILLSMDRT